MWTWQALLPPPPWFVVPLPLWGPASLSPAPVPVAASPWAAWGLKAEHHIVSIEVISILSLCPGLIAAPPRAEWGQKQNIYCQHWGREQLKLISCSGSTTSKGCVGTASRACTVSTDEATNILGLESIFSSGNNISTSGKGTKRRICPVSKKDAQFF